MIKKLIVTLVLCLCFSWASARLKNPQATLLDCTVDLVSGYCADCLNQIVCSQDNTQIINTCPTDQVCQEISGGFSICADPLDVAGCDCPVTGIKVQADLYDDAKFVLCMDGIAHIQTCDEGSIFDTETNHCELPPTTTTPEPTTEFVPMEQCPDGEFDIVAVSCTQYRYCSQDGTTSAVEDCDLGQIFNTDTNRCEFFYPFNCTEKDNGYYTDSQDCNVYHLCVDGDIYGNELTCPDGEYFDQDLQKCASDATCNAIQDCGICPDAKTFIAIEECKSYYQCVKNTDPETNATLPYVPVYQECPSGTCFSPETTYCEF